VSTLVGVFEERERAEHQPDDDDCELLPRLLKSIHTIPIHMRTHSQYKPPPARALELTRLLSCQCQPKPPNRVVRVRVAAALARFGTAMHASSLDRRWPHTSTHDARVCVVLCGTTGGGGATAHNTHPQLHRHRTQRSIDRSIHSNMQGTGWLLCGQVLVRFRIEASRREGSPALELQRHPGSATHKWRSIAAAAPRAAS
jgi:hypothetical protein